MSMKTMVVMAVSVALLGMSTLVQAGEMKAKAEAATGEMKATTRRKPRPRSKRPRVIK